MKIKMFAWLLVVTGLHFKPLFSQTVVINEMMASNSATLHDEDGESSDWLELFNSSSQPVELTNFGLSDDPRTPFKWKFPAIQLPAHEFLLIFASDKDRKSSAIWSTTINWGDTWRYFLGTSEPPVDWRAVTFDDLKWNQGASGFGYGDADDATVIPAVNSIFLRKSFTVADAAAISQALFFIDYDDAFVAYLNDVEIARANIGQVGDHPRYNQTAITYREATMYQGGVPEKYALADPVHRFRTGQNVLALQVHNQNPGSSDFSAIPFLLVGTVNLPSETPRPVPDLLKSALPQLHTNFKLSATGEIVTLTNPQGQIADQVDSVQSPTDVSWGRQPDGSANWFYFNHATPGSSNITEGFEALIAPPVFSQPGGFYNDPVTLILSTSVPNASIRYTLDGSEPSAQAARYEQPILINKTTVLRAQTYLTGRMPSKINTATYFYREHPVLPVISLTTDPFNLWDPDSGIYIMGKNAQPDNPHWGANFWQDWERPIHIEFFEPDGKLGFTTDAGVKIFGGWSRAFDQRSLALFFRAQYGASELNYPLFSNQPWTQFESIVLRNSGNDWVSTMFRDALMQQIVQHTAIDVQAYRPASIFLNSAYWGILNIREKVNEHYLATHHGVDPDELDLLENEGNPIEGDAQHYQHLLNFVNGHTMTEATVWDSIHAWVDLDNFWDYQIAQIYYDNTDWPGNNIKFWRPHTPTGKWRWLMFDTDFGFGLYNSVNYMNNTLEFATAPNGPDWPNPPWSTLLLRKFLANPRLKVEFINRYADHLNSTLLSIRVIQLITGLQNGIKSEITRHRQRWPESASNWSSNVQVLIQFANQRPSYARAHIIQKFKLTGVWRLNLETSPSATGQIQVNSLTLREFPWNGSYFQNIPIQVQAIPVPGFRFKGWSSSAWGEQASITIQTTKDVSLTAIFEATGTPAAAVVINEICYNPPDDFNPGDWIELYNPDAAAVDISGWVFQDEDNSHRFQIPPGTILPANGFLVLCQDRNAFTPLFPNVQNYLGNFDFGLSGAGELLRLISAPGKMIDSLVYDDAAPWPTAPDGQGPTLELIHPTLDNALGTSWVASAGRGGTPGRQNSGYSEVHSVSLSSLTFELFPNYPNPFNATTTIEYHLPVDGWVTLRIFNLRGQRIQTVVDQIQPAGRYRLNWPNQNNAPGDIPFASGVYFCQIDTRSGSSHYQKLLKLVLLK